MTEPRFTHDAVKREGDALPMVYTYTGRKIPKPAIELTERTDSILGAVIEVAPDPETPDRRRWLQVRGIGRERQRLEGREVLRSTIKWKYFGVGNIITTEQTATAKARIYAERYG